MKNYTSYQKTERPYVNFSELLGFPVLPLFAIAAVSYLILFFFGLTLMVIANIAITAVLTFIYHGLQNASPNGSRNVNTYIPGFIVILSLLPSFLVILGVLFITNIGAYIVVTFQHTGVFYETCFYIWLFTMFVLPVIYFVLDELKYHFKLYYQARNFTPLPLNIVRDYELLTGEIRLTVLHTRKQLRSEQAVAKPKSTDHVGKLAHMSVAERNACLYEPLFDETVHIPENADRLLISWYSAIEDAYYEDEIDFPFDKLEYVQNQYPSDISKVLRGKKTDRVSLLLMQGGKIQLFNKHKDLMGTVSVKSVVLSEEDKKQKREAIASMYQVKKLPALIHAIQQSGAIEKRAVLTEYTYSWQVSGTLKEHHVEIKDVKHNYTTSDPIALNVFEKRRLPIFFEIDYQKTVWLYIHIDAEKLYSLIQTHGYGDHAVTFDLQLDPQKGAANMIVKVNDKIMPFAAWEKKVDEYRLKELKDYFLKNKEHLDKNNFLKEIGECIVAKDYAATAELCKTAHEMYPYFPMIYFYEARLLWYNESFDASYAKKEYFMEKTKTDPYASAQIYNHYGCLYDEQKRYAEALVCFEKAYDIYPGMLYYLANIAEIHYKLKHAEKAVYYAKECLKKECTLDIITEIIDNKGIMKNE